jgi:hypothetical protein
MPAWWYRKALANMLGGEAAGEARATDYLSDTLKVMLAASGYALNLDTHEVKADVTNEVTGTGYVAGGATVGSKTITYTPANSWGVAWAANTPYAVGDVVRPTTGNGKLYVAITAGTSHATTEPVWTTTLYDEQPGDGTVTWCCIGSGIVVIDAADPSWGPGATISGIRYAVLYNDTPADKPLIWVNDYGSDQAVTNGTFTAQLPSTGFIHLFAP